MSFTPGPWEAKGVKGCFYHVRSAKEHIAEVIPREDNARAIALVPEMVKKLEQTSCLLHGASTLDWLGAEASKGIADEVDVLLRQIKGEEEAE